jgi:hypothetical protein
MFTFKKLALVGVAGLAAFAMSCSDTDGDEAGGSYTTPFGATVDSEGDVALSGVITANTGANVTGLTATADGKNVAIGLPPTLNAPTVNLGDSYIFPVTICTAIASTDASKTVKIEVSATFSEGGKLTESKSVTISCSTGTLPTDPALNIKSITLSSAGDSFGDVDAGATYNSAAAAAVKDKIDLIAFIPSIGAAGNTIYSPYHDDITWDKNEVFFFAIGATDAATVKAATKLSEVSDFITTGVPAILDDAAADLNEKVDIANDLVFLVSSSDSKRYVVIVTATATSSVTLKVVALSGY